MIRSVANTAVNLVSTAVKPGCEIGKALVAGLRQQAPSPFPMTSEMSFKDMGRQAERMVVLRMLTVPVNVMLVVAQLLGKDLSKLKDPNTLPDWVEPLTPLIDGLARYFERMPKKPGDVAELDLACEAAYRAGQKMRDHLESLPFPLEGIGTLFS